MCVRARERQREKTSEGERKGKRKGREAGGKGRLNAQSCKDIKKTPKDNDATYKQLLTDFFN